MSQVRPALEEPPGTSATFVWRERGATPPAAPTSPTRDDVIQDLLRNQQELQETVAQFRRLLEAHFGSSAVEPRSTPAPLAPASPAGSAVSVYCLGPFGLSVYGRPVEGWRPGKARALFQYLVTNRHRNVGREALIGALWPSPDALAAGSSLKVAVHGLRQWLSQLAGGDLLTVNAQGSGYQLAAQGLWLDVEEFERCCTRARGFEASNQRREALAEYERAAELYRGDFLQDSAEDWTIFRRESLRDRYLIVLARLADEALAAGDYAACIDRCQRILEFDPCREDAYRALMVCHAGLGQRGRIRDWYAVCVRTMNAELGVTPEAETTSLYRRAVEGGIAAVRQQVNRGVTVH